MKRTTIFLPESLERDLQGEARRTGKALASVVREALVEYVVARQSKKGSRKLSFVACGAGDRTDVAERHEELLWASPHDDSSPALSRKTTRRKAR
jgi:hypothetical protein